MVQAKNGELIDFVKQLMVLKGVFHINCVLGFYFDLLKKKCLPIIPCCLEGSDSCEEKLGCFVKFGNCAKVLGDEKDRK